MTTSDPEATDHSDHSDHSDERRAPDPSSTTPSPTTPTPTTPSPATPATSTTGSVDDDSPGAHVDDTTSAEVPEPNEPA